MNCRHCSKSLEHVFLDLGFAPPSNAYLSVDDLTKPEVTFPLKLYVCEHCWLVQTEDYTDPDALFTSDYAYFSSVSKGWCEHAKIYTDEIIERLALDDKSYVVEIASNDGYLLKNFVQYGIPCLGVEPTQSTGDAAKKIGIPVLKEFFGASLANKLAREKQADLIIGNNVYAHVPDINDFTMGLKRLLKNNGTITLEFPHLLNLIRQCQFDTVYHEHYSYLSLYTVDQIFKKNGLVIYDVEKLPTHGGSLRVYACHDDQNKKTSSTLAEIINEEKLSGLRDLSTYLIFQQRVEKIKHSFLLFLVEQAKLGKRVAAYGAAAKGNTIINYSGIKKDLINYVVDRSIAKQGKLLPGSSIPIVTEDKLKVEKPDYLVLLPWNIKDELMNQLDYIKSWGGQFVIATPELELY